MRNLAFSLLLIGIAPGGLEAQQTLREQMLTLGVSEEVVLVEYPQMSLRMMAATAGAAVHVKIRNFDTFVSTAGTAIFTDYRAVVVDIVKDASSRIGVGDVITVRRIGGVANIEGRSFFSNESGFPQFASGSDYVLFLKTDAGQPYELVAGAQSAYQVRDGNVAPVADDSTGGPTAVLLPLFLHEVREQIVYRASSTR